MGLFGNFFGAKKTTTTTALDAKSQAYLDAIRGQSGNASNVALQGPAGGSWFTGPQTMSIGDQAAQFFNPYMKNVIDPINAQYDQLRAQAVSNTGSQATLSNAFGGARQALLTGARLGELDRGQAQQVGDLMYGGYNNALQQGTAYTEQQRQLQEQKLQEPLYRQQMAQQFLNLGMGPTSGTTVTGSTGGGFGDLIKNVGGIASIASGMGLFKGGGGNPMGGMSGYQMPGNANLVPSTGYQGGYSATLPTMGNFGMRPGLSFFPRK